MILEAEKLRRMQWQFWCEYIGVGSKNVSWYFDSEQS